MICIITHDTLKTGLKTETLKNCLLFSSGGIPHFLEEKKKTQTIDIKERPSEQQCTSLGKSQ